MQSEPTVGAWLEAWGRAALLVSTLAVPAGIAALVVDGWTGTAVLFGAAVTLFGAMAAGARAARAALPVLVVGGAVATAVLGTVWWVLLVTVLAGLAGAMSVRRAMPAFSMAALAAVVAPGPAATRAAVVYGVGLAIGAVYGLLLAGRMDLPAPSVDVDLPPALVAVVLGGTAGLAAAVAHALGDPRADWIPLTVMVLAGTALRGSRRRTVDRIAGTLAGVVVAVGMAELALSGTLLTGLGVVAMVGALAVGGVSYRGSSLLVTMAVVLIAAPAASVTDLATRRLGYTIAGAVVLAAGAVAARAVLPRLPRPDADPPPSTGTGGRSSDAPG